MSTWAKLPSALAPGMVLNAFFAFAVCLGMGNTRELHLQRYLLKDTIGALVGISDGIVLGLLSYVLINLLCGKFKKISITMYILAALFTLKYLV